MPSSLLFILMLCSWNKRKERTHLIRHVLWSAKGQHFTEFTELLPSALGAVNVHEYIIPTFHPGRGWYVHDQPGCPPALFRIWQPAAHMNSGYDGKLPPIDCAGALSVSDHNSGASSPTMDVGKRHLLQGRSWSQLVPQPWWNSYPSVISLVPHQDQEGSNYTRH